MRLTLPCFQRYGLFKARYDNLSGAAPIGTVVLIEFQGFAGNDSPSFVFPTAIATKGPAAGSGGSGSGRPAVANKPSFLTGGAGPGGHLSGKRGTEDLDFFIGDEALAASAGPGTFRLCFGKGLCSPVSGYGIHYPIRHGQIENWVKSKFFRVQCHGTDAY
jgi:actin-related protein